MFGRLLRIQARLNELCPTDFAVMRKVRDGIQIGEGDDETDALWWLIREEYVAYQHQVGVWLTDKGKKVLDEHR